MKHFYPLFFCLSSTYLGQAQVEKQNAVRFTYEILPHVGDMDIERYHFNGYYNITSGTTRIAWIADYWYQEATYSGNLNNNLESFQNLHTLHTGMEIEQYIWNTWSLKSGISGALSSNFLGAFSNEDLYLLGSLTIQKRWNSSQGFYSIELGTMYSTALGLPQFLPAVSLHHKIHNWHISLGFPQTTLSYEWRHSSLAITAEWEGYYINNQEAYYITPNLLLKNTKWVFSQTSLGLFYKYDLGPVTSALVKAAYVPDSKFSFLDTDNHTITSFQTNETFTIAMGLQIKL